MYELQRRSVAAQEQAAQAQVDSVKDAANYRSQQAYLRMAEKFSQYGQTGHW